MYLFPAAGSDMMGGKIDWHRLMAGTLVCWRLPILVVGGCYLSSYLVSGLIFDVWVQPHRALVDLLLLLILSRLILNFSRHVWAFTALMALLMGAFFVGSSAKIAMLGRPVMPDDVYSVVALVRIMGWLGWIVVVLPLGLIAALLRPRSQHSSWCQ